MGTPRTGDSNQLGDVPVGPRRRCHHHGGTGPLPDQPHLEHLRPRHAGAPAGAAKNMNAILTATELHSLPVTTGAALKAAPEDDTLVRRENLTYPFPPRPQSDEAHAEQEQGGTGVGNTLRRHAETHVVYADVVAERRRVLQARDRRAGVDEAEEHNPPAAISPAGMFNVTGPPLVYKMSWSSRCHPGSTHRRRRSANQI